MAGRPFCKGSETVGLALLGGDRALQGFFEPLDAAAAASRSAMKAARVEAEAEAASAASAASGATTAAAASGATTAAADVAMQRKTAAAGRAAAAHVLKQGEWPQRYLALAGACRRAAECTEVTLAASVLKLQATFVLRSLPQALLDAADGGVFAASMRPGGSFSAFWQSVLFGGAAESVTLYCRVPRAWRVSLGGWDPGCP